MSKSNRDMRRTIAALDQLIATAEALKLDSAAERAALDSLRGRRMFLEGLLLLRRALQDEKIVPLRAWRDGDHDAIERLVRAANARSRGL